MFILFDLGSKTGRSLTAVGIFIAPVALDMGVWDTGSHAARSISRVSFEAGAPLISMSSRANASALPQRPGIPLPLSRRFALGLPGRSDEILQLPASRTGCRIHPFRALTVLLLMRPPVQVQP